MDYFGPWIPALMEHLPNLITDLGLILAVAAITTLIFKKINQPLVLGYIIAGLLVGPNVPALPTVIDEQSVHVWSELGVIFLLFGIGLEFSFKKVLKVGGTSAITALVTVVFMLVLGYFIGQSLGWSSMDSLFLGGIICMSSTTIIVRTLEELGLKSRVFATVVVGVLVIEDLVAVLLLVLLSSLSVSQHFSGGVLLWELGKLGFFLILWFAAGVFLIPTFLARTRKLMNDETLLVVAIALCLMMVIMAVGAGFSSALGAFIMGALLAETVQAEHIESLVHPVKDLFGAIFFVSVGMMLDPTMLLKYWPQVLLLSAVVTIFQPLSVMLGALISGEPLERSVRIGMSLSQIGEFSFIIATLGLTLHVTSNFLYPIAVAVSAVTIFTTPYMIRASDPFSRWLGKVLPHRWRHAMSRYSLQTDRVKETSAWRSLLRLHITNLAVFGVLSLAIILGVGNTLIELFGDEVAGINGRILAGLITFILAVPFIWAMSVRRVGSKQFRRLWANKRFMRGPLVVLEASRLAASVLLLALLVNVFFNAGWSLAVLIMLTWLAAYFFRRRFYDFYRRMEERFFSNLNQRELDRQRADLAPWDMHLSRIRVSNESASAGHSLGELALRERHGVNIALIERASGHTLAAPGSDVRLLPGDNLLVIGTGDRVAGVEEELSIPRTGPVRPETSKEDIRLKRFLIPRGCSLVGKKIGESGLRVQASAMVAGIERGEMRISNPKSDITLEANDVLWLVGNGEKIKTFMEGHGAKRE